ncbi:acyl-CoA thioesterase [Paraflavitalea soli]|uniref:Acyl-CoA thioesterase n=1 Tax=Paraflavitalea soli TaxID=2315862 RepID=A0A3B7MU30_9BACT|nr:acyl-CoA thioesterase [Paraflavitalea soli]AXY76759.1 acyl-CoA thioesterase [Paraflavitalea soli]
MELQSTYRVRFNDCDPLGHLNNARYIDYLLNAREDHLGEFYHLSLPQFHRQGLAWVVKTHDIQYIKPAYYNEKVTIVSRLVELTDTYIRVEMLMYDEKQQALKAVLWTNFTCIDPQTGKRKNHTPEFMDLARTMDLHTVDLAGGVAERVKQLQAQAKANAA